MPAWHILSMGKHTLLLCSPLCLDSDLCTDWNTQKEWINILNDKTVHFGSEQLLINHSQNKIHNTTPTTTPSHPSISPLTSHWFLHDMHQFKVQDQEPCFYVMICDIHSVRFVTLTQCLFKNLSSGNHFFTLTRPFDCIRPGPVEEQHKKTTRCLFGNKKRKSLSSTGPKHPKKEATTTTNNNSAKLLAAF